MIRSVVLFLMATLALIAFRRVLQEAKKLAVKSRRRVTNPNQRHLPTLRPDPETGVYRPSNERW